MIREPILGIGVALLISTAFGYFVAAGLLPSQLRPRFAWALAPGVGLVLSSLIFFVFRRPIFTVEAGLLIAAAVRGVAVWKEPKLHETASESRRPPTVSLILASAMAVAIAGSLIEVDRMPHGYSDGWMIWNSHARLLSRGGPNWTDDLPYVFHGDYPLLTPSLAARFWRYAGREIPEAGAIAGILACLSAVVVLLLTLNEYRDAWLTGLMGLLLLTTPAYLDYGASQYADVPLSFFILCTIALIFLHMERQLNESRLLVLAGFVAGCAGWTKNEGLLLIVAASCALVAVSFFKRLKLSRQFVPFLLGLFAPLLIIAAFKMTIAPANDLIANQEHKTIEGIFNFARHRMIIRNAAGAFRTFGEWSIPPIILLIVFVALRGIDWRMIQSSGWLTGLVTLCAMAFGYYFVYLVTPLPLQYHLDSSLPRLILQLWPSALLLLGLVTRPLLAH